MGLENISEKHNFKVNKIKFYWTFLIYQRYNFVDDNDKSPINFTPANTFRIHLFIEPEQYLPPVNHLLDLDKNITDNRRNNAVEKVNMDAGSEIWHVAKSL